MTQGRMPVMVCCGHKSISIQVGPTVPPGWHWGVGRGLGLLGAHCLRLGGIFVWDG